MNLSSLWMFKNSSNFVQWRPSNPNAFVPQYTHFSLSCNHRNVVWNVLNIDRMRLQIRLAMCIQAQTSMAQDGCARLSLSRISIIWIKMRDAWYETHMESIQWRVRYKHTNIFQLEGLEFSNSLCSFRWKRSGTMLNIQISLLLLFQLHRTNSISKAIGFHFHRLWREVDRISHPPWQQAVSLRRGTREFINFHGI